MRPVKRALKNIDVKETGISDEHEMDKIKRHLLEIGDRINECVSRYSDPELIKEWRTNLWIFVSKFTTWTPDRLKNVFKKLAKSRDDRLGLHNQDSNENDSKYKKAMVRDAPSSHSLTNSANPSPSFANKFIKRASNEYEQAGWCSSSTASSNRPASKPISSQASSAAPRSSSRYEAPKSSHHYQPHHHGWSYNASSYNSASGSSSSSRKSWQQPALANSSNFSQPNDPYSHMTPSRGWQNAPHQHQRTMSTAGGSQVTQQRSSSSTHHHHNSAQHHSNVPLPPIAHHSSGGGSSSSNRKSTDVSFKRSSNMDPRRRSEHLIKPPEPT